jgi:hypothetical protein
MLVYKVIPYPCPLGYTRHTYRFTDTSSVYKMTVLNSNSAAAKVNYYLPSKEGEKGSYAVDDKIYTCASFIELTKNKAHLVKTPCGPYDKEINALSHCCKIDRAVYEVEADATDKKL